MEKDELLLTTLETSQDYIEKSEKALEIESWMSSYLAKMLEVDESRIDVTAPFDRYGLDSAAAVGMMGDLETWLETEIDPIIVYDYPNIEALAQHLAGNLES